MDALFFNDVPMTEDGLPKYWGHMAALAKLIPATTVGKCIFESTKEINDPNFMRKFWESADKIVHQKPDLLACPVLHAVVQRQNEGIEYDEVLLHRLNIKVEEVLFKRLGIPLPPQQPAERVKTIQFKILIEKPHV